MPRPDDPKLPDLELIAELDRTVHAPARLLILARLAIVESADFNYLLRATQLSKGNLSTHLAKLETAGYVAIAKEFVDKIPRTLIRLTDRGRAAIAAYRDAMRTVVDDLLGAQSPGKRAPPPRG